jgi:3-deoxy-manno-octulosonate cytidylyltransferase (CMP-KDO synthetase)
MSVDFHVIIPARYQSSRLPGKLLMELHGRTILERVYRQALQAKPKTITIATDSQLIFELATSFGAPVVMTAATHQSGTDRIAEVVAKHKFSPKDIIVNVQGDEPLIAPALIAQVAKSLASTTAPMATLCWPIDNPEMFHNPNLVKVVRDRHNNALYFSRSPIPFCRDDAKANKHVYGHIGLYAYRADFLLEVVSWPVCEIEAIECLEQLRVLWAGYHIKVEEACVRPLQDINTEEDLARARFLLAH